MITSFLASFFIRKVDIVVGTSPQFFTAVSAWMIAGFKRKPFVFELRDLWPESIISVGVMHDSAASSFREVRVVSVSPCRQDCSCD